MPGGVAKEFKGRTGDALKVRRARRKKKSGEKQKSGSEEARKRRKSRELLEKQTVTIRGIAHTWTHLFIE